jgi:hypothetical protein
VGPFNKLENSMINIAQTADRIANILRDSGTMAWDLLRDFCDQQTGGDLDYLQLDILTDSVQSRLSK